VTLGELFEEGGMVLHDGDDRGDQLPRYVRDDSNPSSKVPLLAPETTTLDEIPTSISRGRGAAGHQGGARRRRRREAPRRDRAARARLHALHAAGKVHRDIKPSNIL